MWRMFRNRLSPAEAAQGLASVFNILILKRRRIAEPARLGRERRLPRAWTAQEICVRKSACQPLFSYCFSAQTGGKALGSGWPLFGRAEQRGGIFSRGEPAAWIF